MMTIRPARFSDAEVIADFNSRMAWETEHKQLDMAILLPGVRAVLTSNDKGFYTVVEKAGDVVGQCLITYEWSDWRNGWFWWIQSVYVREDQRGHGIWSQLYRHIVEQAKKQGGVIGIRLYVERANERAKAAYTKLGMSDGGYDIMEQCPLD